MSSNGKIKVGSITLALSLITGGAALLVYNFGGLDSIRWVWNLWPLLLIGLGVEYFARKASAKDKDVSFHVPSILLIVLFILASGVGTAITGVANNIENYIGTGIIESGSDYEYSWNWSSNPVEVAPEENFLRINQRIGKLNLESSQDNKLHISSIFQTNDKKTFQNLSGKFHPEIKRDGEIVNVAVPDINSDSHEKKIRMDLTVKVPRGMQVEAESTLGEINAKDLQNKIKVQTKLGAIKLTGIQEDIDAGTHSGKIEIIDAAGDVSARTNLGQVSFRSQKPVSGQYNLVSNVGNIVFDIPGKSNIIINASSKIGSINVSGLSSANYDENGTNNEAHIVMGNGKGSAKISVSTGSANIDVH
ncbi:MAG: hypothetical protein K9L17_13830 [Clostridiales bacterium]|nr:hypothetical protein [Clostridiales bacterium]MCF8023752.1 hypothetical protein [Clostridiales bacterium]